MLDLLKLAKGQTTAAVTGLKTPIALKDAQVLSPYPVRSPGSRVGSGL